MALPSATHPVRSNASSQTITMSMDSTSSTPTILTLFDPNEVAKTALPPPLEGIAPHDEFWFPDGNLILVARDVAFRVYRCLLSDQSTVFADMFAGASVVADEMFEACPIVRLSDSPQDLTHLFRILLPKKDEKKHTFDEVAALARLSHKYRIQDVEEQALDLLRQWYTDSFDQWSQVPASISVSSLHAIGAVNIARLTDTPPMLPISLYSCCYLGPDLLDGWKREDGQVEHLSVDDLKICFAARERLCKEGAQIFFKIFHDQPSHKCSSVDKCRAALNEMAQALVKANLSLAVECNVLSSWKSVIVMKAAIHGACSACKKELLARDEKARRQVWDKFPDIFGISVPGWGSKVGRSVTAAATA
ncbi:hypothetical protein LXA43DRAFT_1108500 [Ganoderma leucocontextum]|nr:hypothetical protein LXA43DRAFT_1108500 [Ganoderma leucocontextum]